MPRAANQSIAERLLPDDEVVQVTWDVDVAVFDPEPTATQMLNVLAQQSSLIVTVDIVQITGILVDDGKWVATRFTGAVVDVLRSSGRERISRGHSIAAAIGGGEVKIGKVLVRASDAPAYPSKRRYLMFLGERDPETKAFSLSHSPLLIEKRRLVAVPSKGSATEKLHGLALGDVRREILAAK